MAQGLNPTDFKINIFGETDIWFHLSEVDT